MDHGKARIALQQSKGDSVHVYRLWDVKVIATELGLSLRSGTRLGLRIAATATG